MGTIDRSLFDFSAERFDFDQDQCLNSKAASAYEPLTTADSARPQKLQGDRQMSAVEDWTITKL
jgi:hypothetical protein